MTREHRHIHSSLLVLLFIGGATGAPLIGPLRENLQASLGVSRGQLGLGIFASGLLAGLIGLWSTVRFRETLHRTTFVRLGAALGLGGMVLFAAFSDSPRTRVIALVVGWLLVSGYNVLRAIAQPIVMDLWTRSPQTGVILLHGVNSVGKVFAPLLVLAAGPELRTSALVYVVALSLLCVDMALWPRRGLATLRMMERDQLTSTEPPGRTWRGAMFWWAVVQFGLIAGAEAGVTSILGSFILWLRPSPVPGLDAGRWAAAMIVCTQVGICAGRFLFVAWQGLSERQIIALCVLCGLFALPGALCPWPAVYAPCLLLLGLTFSATYPAYFALSARSFVAHRTAYAMAGGLSTQVGINLCIWLSSALGNRNGLLPAAVIASTGVMAVFAVFLFATPLGRRLGREG